MKERRSIGHTLRDDYAAFSARETDLIRRIRASGEEFLELLHEAGGTRPMQSDMGSRALLNSRERLQEAVLWAVMHVTRNHG